MIAAKPFHDRARGLGRNAFDLPVAALAGLAAAFLAFAMPAEMLGRLIVATGLPHLLAAAAPPLGFKARALLGVAGAGVAFGLAFLLLRRLDGIGRARKPADPDSYAGDGPKLRRRDAHPDAPVCRPISAARDFGEPAPPQLDSAAPIPVAADLDEPAPLLLETELPDGLPVSAASDPEGAPTLEFDRPVDPPLSAASDVDEQAPPLELDVPAESAAAPDFEELALPPPESPAPMAPWLDEDEAESEDDRLSQEGPWTRRIDLYSGTPARQPIFAVQAFADAVPPAPAQPVEGVEEAPARTATPAWLPEPAGRKPTAPAAQPAAAPASVAVPAPPRAAPAVEQVAPIAAPVVEAAPEPLPPAPAERIHQPVAEPALGPVEEPAAGPVTEASLSDLMRRFEHGLARRRGTGRSYAAPQAQAPVPQVFPEANDDRLQNAIESLQRFAARGD